MHCDVYYHCDRRYNKPYSIEAFVRDEMFDEDPKITSTQRFSHRHEAHAAGKSIGVRFDSFKEHWINMQLAEEPPQIITEDAQ